MEAAMLALPPGHRVVGIRAIVPGDPRGGPVIVGGPVEVVHEQLPLRAKQPDKRRGHDVQLGVVQRHDRDGCVKRASRSYVLEGLADQARAGGSGRINADRVETKFHEAVGQAAVTAPDIEDTGACRKRSRDDRVEVCPPPGIGHGQKPYLPSNP
jgi:hypothetical protein